MRSALSGLAPALALGLALVVGAPALAGPPVEPSVRLLLRVLSYDTALPTRVESDGVVIGVVFDPSDPVSAAQGAEALAALRHLAGITVAGIPLAPPASLPIGTSWDERLPYVAAVLVCPTSAPIDDLRAAADRLDRPTLGLDAARVSGVSVAVGLRQAHLEIVVSLARARAEGMAPSPELLEVAQVIP